jgi:hypothetical protein
MLDFHDSDKYLRTPEELQQEQVQQAQQATQAEMMSHQMQKDLISTQTQGELTRDVVKGLMQ